VAAGESVAVSILSQDREAWIAMTQPASPNGTGAMSVLDVQSPSRRESAASDGAVLEGGKVDHSPPAGREANAIDGYFKVRLRLPRPCPSAFDAMLLMFVRRNIATQKLLTVGIQLLLNDPPASGTSGPRLNRAGKMFLQYGTRSAEDGSFERPRLLWTDGHDVSYALELLDVRAIRPPEPSELEGTYPFAAPDRSFFISTSDGAALLFEALDGVQMTRVTSALRGIIGRLAKKIVMGENDWVVQMMLASVTGGAAQSLEEVEGEAPRAMADAAEGLISRTTGLMRQAQERRSRLRSTRHATTAT